MKVVDLIPGYIRHVIEEDNYVLYHKMYPALFDHYYKYWSPVGRVNNVYGDTNLICSCPPLSSYEEEDA